MSWIQKDDAAAGALGRELRESSNGHMTRRRGAVCFSLLSMASLGVIALYQTGVLKHVPEPPLPGLDADKVNGSAQAYRYLSTPDAVLGIGSYAASLSLAAMGSPDRARRQPWIPLAWAAKTGADAVVAAKLTLDEAKRHHAFCLWCLVAAGAAFACVPLAIPEARAALNEVLQRLRKPACQ